MDKIPPTSFKLHEQIIGEVVSAEQAAERIMAASGPVIYMGTITPEAAARVQQDIATNLCRETSVDATRAKARMMIDRTFIPIGPRHEPRTLRLVSHKHFRAWVVRYFTTHQQSIKFGPLNTTFEEREEVLREMVRRGISPLMLTQ